MQLNSTHSVIACRITRVRLAPMAMRTAVSARREVPRASIRLAMFAQAISSTTVDRIISIFNPVPASYCKFWMPPPAGTTRTCCLGIKAAPPFAVYTVR